MKSAPTPLWLQSTATWLALALLASSAACSSDDERPGTLAPSGARGGTGGTQGGSGGAAAGGSTSGGAGGGGAGGSGATGGTGGVSGGGTGGTSGIDCSGGVAPNMVAVTAISGVEFCIDTTEVTNAQYQAFLDTNPSGAQQPSECSWNANLTPSSSWPPGAQRTDHPVTFVDYCDAVAYCAWAGKSLCGNLDGTGNVNQTVGISNATESQWYAACSGGGGDYPYGDTFDASACNGATDSAAVGSNADCTGSAPPFNQIFDLTGNVQEWEQNCIEGGSASDQCLTRGGSFSTDQFPETQLWCRSSSGLQQRSSTSADVGFRCCRGAG